MKSPDELAVRLTRQWQNADLREQRLLHPKCWPLRISIGRPSGAAVRDSLELVRQHLHRWRQVSVGQVEWQRVRFLSASDAIEIPNTWILASPSEWVQATGNREVEQEYQLLSRLASALDPRFHPLILRRRTLVLDKPESDVILCGKAALQLHPGCAKGRPLRALSVTGIDSKFFERNRQLVTLMLDVLFDGRVSEIGLGAFLGAQDEGHHWLLVADLDGTLMPFSQIRVRADELRHTALPGERLLLVENERCLHQLPTSPGTIAVLGSGLNLSWLQAQWLAHKAIAYWGDLDTWGLTMLGRARAYAPHLTPLLMSQAVYNRFREESAVKEPEPASLAVPSGLTGNERELYNLLLTAARGRLEQEFLPIDLVHGAVGSWRQGKSQTKHRNPAF